MCYWKSSPCTPETHPECHAEPSDETRADVESWKVLRSAISLLRWHAVAEADDDPDLARDLESAAETVEQLQARIATKIAG